MTYSANDINRDSFERLKVWWWEHEGILIKLRERGHNTWHKWYELTATCISSGKGEQLEAAMESIRSLARRTGNSQSAAGHAGLAAASGSAGSSAAVAPAHGSSSPWSPRIMRKRRRSAVEEIARGIGDAAPQADAGNAAPHAPAGADVCDERSNVEEVVHGSLIQRLLLAGPRAANMGHAGTAAGSKAGMVRISLWEDSSSSDAGTGEGSVRELQETTTAPAGMVRISLSEYEDEEEDDASS